MLMQKLNQNWTAEIGDGSSLGALFGVSGPAPKPVTLPHDYVVEIPRNPQEPNGPGNGFFHEDNFVYKTNLALGPETAGKRIVLEFEGVYHNSFVYVNGSFAGKCPYGYSNFYLDITSFVKVGDNAIKVIVKNGVPSGRWYTGGGIYRDVNLMIADPTHIAPDGVFVYADDIDGDLARITASIEVENEALQLKTVILKTTLFDADGSIAAEGQIPVTLKENAKEAYSLHLFVKNPKLWSDETPNLYTYKAEILAGEEVLDTECGSFGIRKLQLDPIHGLRVNGKTVKLRGGCIHHDNGIIGTREFPFAAEMRVKKLKEAGFNAIRSSHNPMSRRLLEACDKYGMYVMDEFSDIWTTSKVTFDYSNYITEWWEHDIRNLVRKDRNHPCVIMYSIGNEIPETGNAIDSAWGKKFADLLKALDPTRYTTNSLNLLLAGMDALKQMAPGGDKGAEEQTAEINTIMSNLGEFMLQLMQSPLLAKATEEAASQVDIVGYNYALGRYEPEGTEYPNRILVGSETNPPALDKNWAAVEKLPYVIGDFDWTAWDYLGENGIGITGYGESTGPMGMMYAPYPVKAGYCGDINLIGDRRPVSYWREIIWGLRTAPYIAVQPPKYYGVEKHQSQWVFTDAFRSWNFAEYAGKGIVVEVYADADEVELFINGKSAGRKAPGESKRALTVFDTIYEPGCVEAVAYKNGVEIGRDCIMTAGDDVQLSASVTLPGAALPADGSDIAYIDLSVVDSEGRLNMEAVKSVSYTCEGPGCVIGFGSATPSSEENYYDTTALTYEGRLRAAVRATGEGTIRVTFTADGCTTTAELTAR